LEACKAAAGRINTSPTKMLGLQFAYGLAAPPVAPDLPGPVDGARGHGYSFPLAELQVGR